MVAVHYLLTLDWHYWLTDSENENVQQEKESRDIWRVYKTSELRSVAALAEVFELNNYSIVLKK